LRAGGVVIGCDGTRASPRRWCAGVVALVRGGLPVDPRLSLTCRDATGEPVGFGWIQSVRGASWIVVGSKRAAERYAAGGALPIRVTTQDVELDSAGFEVAQFDAYGHELERRRITVHAAG